MKNTDEKGEEKDWQSTNRKMEVKKENNEHTS